MNLFNIITRFPDQQSCIDHLEKIRFGDEPYCPLCGVVDFLFGYKLLAKLVASDKTIIKSPWGNYFQQPPHNVYFCVVVI